MSARQCPMCGTTNIRRDAGFCSRACYWANWRKNQPPCSVDGCDAPRKGRSFCEKHYQRLRANGHLSSARDLTPDQRFWRQVDIAGSDDCWEWQGHRNEHGYGRWEIQGDPRVRVYAHRYAYQMATGVDVASHVIMHACDNPPCCNPAHLSHGTQADNVADMFAKGRMNLSGLELGWRRKRDWTRRQGEAS